MFAGTEGVVVPAEFAGSIVQAFRGWGGPEVLRFTLIFQTSNALHTSPLLLCLGRSGADHGGTHRGGKQTEGETLRPVKKWLKPFLLRFPHVATKQLFVCCSVSVSLKQVCYCTPKSHFELLT